ncbi:hypothetical protein, partial [Klebsiella pneumoniae]|uniref:hypothetical protein n=1 Tax=Klebsiella pneumoniae TaxID=573 RepID=UPI004055409D
GNSRNSSSLTGTLRPSHTEGMAWDGWGGDTGRDVRDAEDSTPHLVLYDYQDTRSGRCPESTSNC